MANVLHSLKGHENAAKDVPFSRPTTPGQAGPSQIGFVGLGAIGYFMARNLISNRPPHSTANPHLIVWNRTESKSEKLQKELGHENVKIAQSLKQIAVECDIIITNLANDEVVESVYEEFTAALKASVPTKRKVFVETSTIYPKLAGKLDNLVSAIPHAHLITSPVFGAPPAADKAQLIIVMSGDYRSKKEVAHHFVPAVGRKVIDLGGNLEKAPTFKLIGNSMIIGCLEILAESFTLAEKSGIGAEAANALVKDFLPAGPLIAYGDKMINDKFDGTQGFAIDGGIKDASHIRRLTTELDSPMPVIDIAHQNMLTARALHATQKREGKEGFDTLDWSAMIAGRRVAAGLDPFDSGKHSNNLQTED